jgi:TRAP-type mannitol/chloroaromatic compound transport system substrate-binding protein
VVKYNLFPGWHQQFTAQYMLINQDQWNKTTEAQKALVEASCTAATTLGLAEGEYKNGKVLAEFQEKGVQADQIPRDVLKELKAVTEEVMEEEASKDADFKRVYESQSEFMETYKVWDTRAYVPADL